MSVVGYLAQLSDFGFTSFTFEHVETHDNRWFWVFRLRHFCGKEEAFDGPFAADLPDGLRAVLELVTETQSARCWTPDRRYQDDGLWDYCHAHGASVCVNGNSEHYRTPKVPWLYGRCTSA